MFIKYFTTEERKKMMREYLKDKDWINIKSIFIDTKISKPTIMNILKSMDDIIWLRKKNLLLVRLKVN